MLEPYSEGTVNVVAGSDTITGNNTYWARQIRAGDKISVDHDVWYIVTSVNSDTDIKIDAAYLGATAQAKAYIIARDSAQWGMNAAISADVASLMKTYKLGLQAPIDQVAEMKQEVTVLKDEAVEAKTDAQTARQTAVSAAGTSTQAKDAAIDAKNEAVAAKTAAETAAQNAAASETAALSAKDVAVTAKDVAVTAKTAAETAAISSANSQDAAATSASVSADSSAASASAKNDAVAAKEAAENAKTAAVAAKDAAVSAKTTALSAKDAAVTAKTAAIAGATAAETARDIATTKASEAAASAANAANSAAAAAQSAADAAATVPEATETVAGKIAIATESEVAEGIVTSKAITPATLMEALLRITWEQIPTANITRTADTAIVIPGDVRTAYPKGKRLRFNSADTYLCRVYGDPTYSSGATTITVWFDTRTTAIPTTITTMERSRLTPQDTANGAPMHGTDSQIVQTTLMASYCCGCYITD